MKLSFLLLAFFGYLVYTYLVKPVFIEQKGGKPRKSAPNFEARHNYQTRTEPSTPRRGEYIDYEEVDD